MGGAFRHVTLAQGRCCCGLGITPLRAEDRAREAPPQRKVDAFGEMALAGCEKTMLACQTSVKGATGGTSEMGKTRGSPVCPRRAPRARRARRALVRLAYSSSILLARLGEIIEMGQRVT